MKKWNYNKKLLKIFKLTNFLENIFSQIFIPVRKSAKSISEKFPRDFILCLPDFFELEVWRRSAWVAVKHFTWMGVTQTHTLPCFKTYITKKKRKN